MFESKNDNRITWPIIGTQKSFSATASANKDLPEYPPSQITTANSAVVINPQTERIDVEKLDPQRVLIDERSFMVPPNSYYYLHNIRNLLNIKFDPVRSGSGKAFTYQKGDGNLSVTYNFGDKQYSLDEYFKRSSTLGFLVLHGGQIVLEKYLHGSNEQSVFLSNSMSKSILSLLVGIALFEGKIESIDAPIIKFLPVLAKSGFGKLTIRNLLQMDSNVQWNEDYTVPNADINKYVAALLTGSKSFLELAASVKPGGRPGTVFSYQSINSQVLGAIVERAVGMPINIYLEKKIWSRMGAQSDGFFYRGRKQKEIGIAGCFNATLRDYGLLGLVVSNAGIAPNGKRILPESWIKQIANPRAHYLKGSPPSKEGVIYGYNHQWWLPYKKGERQSWPRPVMAMGIFGQGLYIDPLNDVVIVQMSAWNQPDPEDKWDEMLIAMRAISQRIGNQG